MNDKSEEMRLFRLKGEIMNRIMILSQDDFTLDQNVEDHSLRTLKPHVKKEEPNFDVIAYLKKDKLIVFKNRFGSIDSVILNSDLTTLLSQD